MSPEAILEALWEFGVLEPAEDDEDELAFSSAFLDRQAAWAEALSAADDLEAEVNDGLEDDVIAGQLTALAGENVDFLSYYLALDELADEPRPYDEQVRLVLSLYQLRDAPDHTELVPEHFINVDGDWLEVYVRSSDQAVVYVWREECDECDLVRGDFDEIFEEPSAELGLYAVFGPPHAETLHETFNIVGAPTVLFVLDGRVDARLHGPHTKEVLESEIDYLLEQA